MIVIIFSFLMSFNIPIDYFYEDVKKIQVVGLSNTKNTKSWSKPRW